MAISRRWPEPEHAYREWHQNRKANNFRLGKIQLVQVESDLWVANMIGQHGLRKQDGNPPIRYSAVEECLRQIARAAKEKKANVHMPRIGCGLAGGKWEKIEPLIQRLLCSENIEVFVYDLEK